VGGMKIRENQSDLWEWEGTDGTLGNKVLGGGAGPKRKRGTRSSGKGVAGATGIAGGFGKKGEVGRAPRLGGGKLGFESNNGGENVGEAGIW